MMKHLRYMAVAALATVGTACSEGPTDVNEEFEGELVITEGVAAPEFLTPSPRPRFSDAAVEMAVGGTTSTPISLKLSSCSDGRSQEVGITYSVTGRQENAASFKIFTEWTFNGAWNGSGEQTINVAARPAANAAPSVYPVTVTVVNQTGDATGTGQFELTPFGLSTSGQGKLNVEEAGQTVHIDFVACPVTNTAPILTLPTTPLTFEASSSAGAVVNYSAYVSATDAQDGNLTSSVVCVPTSGSTFSLGTTTVTCSVTDSGGLIASGTFEVTVQDTTPPAFTSIPTGTLNAIAANITGAVIDIDTFDITAEDVGGVSEPSTFACDYPAGTVIPIGLTRPISCTATDAAGNESDPSSFQIFVGLNVNGAGFLPPLRMVTPFSAHKRGSTIPHKFLPPTYADGTPAVDLADGLNLTLRRIDGIVEATAVDGTEYAAGSTEWRYDPESGHYIFNLKTGTSAPWDSGTWTTTASFAGITLAATRFDLKK